MSALMRRLGVLSAFDLVVLSASMAAAGSLHTPPLLAQNRIVSCVVVNTGTRDVGPITISLFKSDGSEISKNANLLLSPNEIVRWGHNLSVVNTATVHCKVEGKGVSKTKTPVTLCVTNALGHQCEGAAVSTP